jgi:hypothetical protein
VGKVEGKEVDLLQHTADHRHRLAEVRLGMAGAWPGGWTSGTNTSRDRSCRPRAER